MSWREFWDGEHSIYVSERHSLLHYDRIARDLATFLPGPRAVALDHGCGEALSAGALAARCAQLFLYDAAPSVQAKLRARFAAQEKIIVLSNGALDLIGEDTLDVVFANSLAQYLDRAEFERLLEFWRERLKPGGRLVVADVLPAGGGALEDARALLRFGWQGGFLFAALFGLARTFFSDYRKLRQDIGLTRYGPEDMLALLGAHGFRAERAADNVGHNPSRMTFVATKT